MNTNLSEDRQKRQTELMDQFELVKDSDDDSEMLAALEKVEERMRSQSSTGSQTAKNEVMSPKMADI